MSIRSLCLLVVALFVLSVSGVFAADHGTPQSGDTYRYNGSAWTANNTLCNNGSGIGIGTTSLSATLDVNGNGVFGLQAGSDGTSRSLTITTRPTNDGIASFGFETGSAYRGDFDFQGTSGNLKYWLWNGSAWNNYLRIDGDSTYRGQLWAKGKNLNTVTVQKPDYVIYQDYADGYYKAVRQSDGVITYDHPSDAAAVITNVLSSYGSALYYSISNPDPDYRPGTTIQLKGGTYVCYQTVIIPPNQDIVFDAEMAVFVDSISGGGDVIRIDSSMDSIFKFGVIVTSNSNSVALRVKPQNQGPDDLIYFTSNLVDVHAVCGSGGSGLVIEAPSSRVVDLSKFEIVEQDMDSGKTGVNIVNSGQVIDNQFHIVGHRFTSTGFSIPNIATGNLFTGHMRSLSGTGVRNTFDTEDTIGSITFNASNTNCMITAPAVTSVTDNASGSTNRVMKASGDSYY